MNIQWSRRALEQAEAAFDYIAEDRPQAGADWIAGLFERVELLPRRLAPGLRHSWPSRSGEVFGADEFDPRARASM